MTEWPVLCFPLRESEAPDATRDGEFLSVRVYTAADPRKRGTEYKIKLKSGDTVRSLKSKIFELDGTPPDFQRFRGTRGKYIDDDAATLQVCHDGEAF